MEQIVKLVETRLKKNIDEPIHEVSSFDELYEATAAQVLSRKTDSAAFVYIDSKLKVVNMQISSIKTLEKHKEEILAMAISHNSAAVLITSNIENKNGNLKAIEFMNNWQQAFNNINLLVVEHIQVWSDKNDIEQSYSFAQNNLIKRNGRIGDGGLKNIASPEKSELKNNEIIFSKSRFFKSNLELKEAGELHTGEKNDIRAVIYAIAEDISTRDKEHTYVLSVDKNNVPINISIASIGTLDQTYADGSIIFKAPILSDAKGIYFIHNHPSGNANPSQLDEYCYRSLLAGGKELGIELHDALVVGAYNKNIYSIKNGGFIDDSYFSTLKTPSVKEEVFQYQAKENTMKNQLEQYANENYEGFIKDLISLEKGIKDEDTLNQIYQEYMKQDNIPLLSKELDELVDKTAEIEKSQKVYLNVHNSFAKLNVESKYEQGKTYNVVRLPEGSVIGDKDYSGASFYPLDKYIYPNKFNENLTTVQFKSGQDIKLYFKDRKPETVEAENICKAVDSANKKYLEQKTEKESGDKEKKPNEISKQRKRQKDLGEEL